MTDGSLRDEGRGRILFASPFVPAEWVAAHGFVPELFRPVKRSLEGPVPLLSGTCAFMRAWVNEAVTESGAAGVVMTTSCDQMRRASDFLPANIRSRFFLMHVPATWQSAGSYAYYLEELRRLGEFLVQQGGLRPDTETLVATMTDFEQRRAGLAIAPRRGAAFTDALNHLYAGRPMPDDDRERVGGIPVAVIGGPLARGDELIFRLVAGEGGKVVLDGTENGEPMLPDRFDRRELRSAPLEVLANAHFFHAPAVFSRPNTRLFGWLGRHLTARGVKGALLVRDTWCDLWHAEVFRLREFLRIPVVEVDISEEEAAARCGTRIQALLETVGR